MIYIDKINMKKLIIENKEFISILVTKESQSFDHTYKLIYDCGFSIIPDEIIKENLSKFCLNTDMIIDRKRNKDFHFSQFDNLSHIFSIENYIIMDL